MQTFNLTQALIHASLTILLTVMLGGIVIYPRILAQRQPDHQIPNLSTSSRMSAQCVEHDHQNALDKKRLAIGMCSDLFRAYALPVPMPEAMDTAIASAFFEVRGIPSERED